MAFGLAPVPASLALLLRLKQPKHLEQTSLPALGRLVQAHLLPLAVAPRGLRIEKPKQNKGKTGSRSQQNILLHRPAIGQLFKEKG